MALQDCMDCIPSLNTDSKDIDDDSGHAVDSASFHLRTGQLFNIPMKIGTRLWEMIAIPIIMVHEGELLAKNNNSNHIFNDFQFERLLVLNVHSGLF